MSAAVACLVAVGFVGGALLAGQASNVVPPDARAIDTVTAAVEFKDYRDQRPVTVHADLIGGGSTFSNAGGVVTSLNCTVASKITSGQSVGSINGRALVALNTSVPLWRDVLVGSSGSDIQALSEELNRLGASVDPGSKLTFDMARSIKKYLAGTGVSYDSRGSVALYLTDVIWISATEVTVKSCSTQVGATVVAGGELFTTAPSISRFTVTSAEVPALQGDRVIVVDGDEFTVTADGRIEDPTEVAAISHLPRVSTWLAGESLADGFGAFSMLVQPQNVASVPPSSLAGIGLGDPCLVGEDGTTVPVVVIDSQLGRAIVLAKDSQLQLPSEVRLDATGDVRCN